MIVINIIQYIFWLIIVPIILGMFLMKKEDKSLLYSWLLGHVFQMGIFFLIALPLVLIKAKFTTLLYTYTAIIILLIIVSLKLNIKRIIIKPKIKKFNIKSIFTKDFMKRIPIFKIIAIILIAMQLFVKIKYANVNNDDASFLSIATTMIQTDKMYLHDENGVELSELIPRRALAPISAYYAVMSRLVNTHVTIFAHAIIPIVFIIFAYSVYYSFSKKLFKEEDSRYIFIILLSVLNLYAFSSKGANRYLLLYTWFGRSILAGALMPFVWSVALDAMNKEKNKLLDWITLFFLVLAGLLCSQMAVPLLITSIAVLALISAIRDKKLSYLFKSFITVIPCIIIGILYLLIK